MTLTGAGSTFDAPFFDLAFARYHQAHPSVTIRYSAVGSSAGIAAFTAQHADFGASDVPMPGTEQGAAHTVLLQWTSPYVRRHPQPGRNYTVPSNASITADAAQKSGITPTIFSTVNEPGTDSYPISGYSWALIYARQPSQATGQALIGLLDWLTHAGQSHAAATSYVPLPSRIQALARSMLQQVTGPGGTRLLG